ncbi:MAG: hypothetical protein SCH71_07240 [Desulfobulbaceae bacterium]|nr:hypothetical protein [Desulfobulbaceae bacterium]
MTARGKEALLKYVWPGRSIPFYAVLAAVLLGCFLLAYYSGSGFRSYRVDFVIETSEPVEFAVYYDIGRGYNETDRQSWEVDELGVPVTVSFCIPVRTELRNIRFDPARKHVKMVLHSITIFYDGDVFEVPLDTVEPGNDIMHSEYKEGRLVFETDPEGDDPVFALTAIRDVSVDRSRHDPFRYVLWLTAGLVVLVAGRFIHRFFFLGL